MRMLSHRIVHTAVINAVCTCMCTMFVPCNQHLFYGAHAQAFALEDLCMFATQEHNNLMLFFAARTCKRKRCSLLLQLTSDS